MTDPIGARHLVPRRRVLRGAGVIGLGLLVAGPMSACGDPRDFDRLTFLNWQDYIDPGLLEDFGTETGIVVTYETYASNDDLARRLEAAQRPRVGGRTGTSFDLIVPSDNFVTAFREAELIRELDLDRLENLDNLDAVFRETSDPNRVYGVPWATGTTGLGYDRTTFDTPPTYDVFLDAAHEGRMSILDEERDALGMSLLSLGEDPNTTDGAAIDAAADRLIEMKANALLDSETYLERLASGDLVVVQGYSSDVLQAREENADIAYVIPAAGGLRWVDSMTIPTGAPRPEGAYTFMDFYLEPEVSARNSEYVKVDTGNAAALEFLPDSIRDDTVIFPPEDVLESLHFTRDVGEASVLYDEAWARVQEA